MSGSGPERRRDHQYFRSLLNRTNAQVGLLDAIDQGYKEFVADVRRILRRIWATLAVVAIFVIAALVVSALLVNDVRDTAASNRALIVRECRDVETLKTAIRRTLHRFVPREHHELARFAPRRCPHRDPQR